MKEKKVLNPEVIESQTLIILPARTLMHVVLPPVNQLSNLGILINAIKIAIYG